MMSAWALSDITLTHTCRSLCSTNQLISWTSSCGWWHVLFSRLTRYLDRLWNWEKSFSLFLIHVPIKRRSTPIQKYFIWYLNNLYSKCIFNLKISRNTGTFAYFRLVDAGALRDYFAFKLNSELVSFLSSRVFTWRVTIGRSRWRWVRSIGHFFKVVRIINNDSIYMLVRF